MAIKCTWLGLLIYIALAADVLAFVMLATRRPPTGWAAYGLGFLAATGAVVLRSVETGRAPLANLMDVMLVLGAIMFPLSLFFRQLLRVGRSAGDALIAALLLFPAGFIFPQNAGPLPPALQSPLFVPHVASYMIAYALMAKAAIQAGAVMLRRLPPPGMVSNDRAVYRVVATGFPFLTAGLLLGAVWGAMAWGNWWNWDPKELWSLASWLVFAGYFHLRAAEPTRRPRLQAALVLLGFLLILITLLWVNLSKIFIGLHSYA